MAEFTVRVELHLADSSDYDKLHESMEANGYSRIILDAYGTRYYLPTAEYTTVKSMTCPAVREQVSRIAGSIKVNPRVLVTEVANRPWQLVKV